MSDPTDHGRQPEQPSGQFQPLQPEGTTPADAAAGQVPPQPDIRYGAPAPKPKRNPVVIWLSIVAGVLVIALIVVIGLLVVGSGGEPSAGSSASPSVSASASATPAPTETSAGETPAAPVRPTDCTQIFPAGYIESLTDGGFLALNPEWSLPELATSFFGSNDSELVSVISSNVDRLNCALVKASGGGDVGIETNILSIDATTQAAVLARMNAAGFTCSEENGGTMCFTEVSEDAGTYGERHFVRDGTWIATRWSNTSISGWTQAIVSTLFPA